MRDGTPPETKETYDRLRSLGYSKRKVMKMLACVALIELNDMARENRTHNEARYVELLKALPKLPWDDDPIW